MNVRLATIGDYVEPVSTWNPSSRPHERFVYVNLSAISQSEKKIISGASIAGSEAPSRARQLIRIGDILVSTVRPNLNGVAAVIDDFDGATASTGFCVLRPRPDKLSSRYLMHWVRSPQFIEQMTRQATGASYPAVTDRIVKSSPIPLPSFDEQRRIAAILDKADALRCKRRRSIELLNCLAQAIFTNMFSRSASMLTISDLLQRRWLLVHKDGNHGSNYPRADEFGETGIPFLSAQSVRDDGAIDCSQIQYLNESKARRLKVGWIVGGDVLLAHNASVGKVGLYDGQFEKALIGTSLTCFRTDADKLLPEYLVGVLRSEAFQDQLTKSMGQTTRNQVPITAQRGLTVCVPPMDQQREYCTIVASQKQSSDTIQRSLLYLESLFSSLQSRAFSGQL